MEYKWREKEQDIINALKKEKMILLKGPRQAGKTTLLLHIKNIKGGTYYTLDDPSTLQLFENNPEDLINDKLIYIDEIQNSLIAGRILRYIYDHIKNVKLIVSGSGAFDKKIGLTAYLVGRLKEINLLPLSFREFVKWNMPKYVDIYEKYHNQVLELIKNGKEFEKLPKLNKLETLLKEYIKFGGYPSVVLLSNQDKELILKRIAYQSVERDIVYFFELKEKNKIINFIKELSFFAGKMLEVSKMGVDYKTSMKYLSILEESFIIKLLPSFHKNPLKEIRKAKKLYFYDLGFREAFTEIDVGHVLENFVFRQLLPEYYWRDKKGNEVDFLLNNIPIEVKTRGSIKQGFFEFLHKYEVERAFVFHYKWEFKKEKRGKTHIYYIPAFYL